MLSVFNVCWIRACTRVYALIGADRRVYAPIGAQCECSLKENADENEIPFTAENETKTDIHFRSKNENESHLIILVFFFPAVKNYNKSLEKLQDFFLKTETKTKTKCSRPRLHEPRPRPRLIFVLETPRDQDPGFEDYITISLT